MMLNKVVLARNPARDIRTRYSQSGLGNTKIAKKPLIIFLLLGTIGLQADDFIDGTKAYLDKNYKKAFKLYKKSCDGCNSMGCVSVGALYWGGKGIKQDYYEAKYYYQKSCNAGNPIGCEHLGSLYYYGQGTQQNYLKAKELFKKACDGNYSFACKQMKLVQ